MKDIELFKFQAEDVQKLKSKKSRLVGSDPGTGKTYIGIVLDQLNRTGDGNVKVTKIPQRPKTLIICPKSVISVWDTHCMDLTNDDIYVYDDNGLSPKQAREKFLKDLLNPWNDGYFVIHWDGLRLIEPAINKKHMEFFHIIADECHRAKNRKAQQTRALKKLKTVYKTGMSGTPADNKPQDLWSILNWLWPTYYGSFWKFVKAYLISEATEEGYTKFVGLNERTLPKLRREMAPWYVRRRKEDVLPDLPDKYYTRIWVDLDPKQRKAYDQMRKTMIAWVETYKEDIERNDPIIAQAVVSQLVRLSQFACGYMVPKLDAEGNHMFKWKWPKGTKREDKVRFKELWRAKYPDAPFDPEKFGAEKKFLFEMIDPSSKLDTVMDLLEDRMSLNKDTGEWEGEQIVIFSQFKSVISLLEKRLVSKGVPYGLLTGDVSQSDRTQAVQDFQSGKIRVFAGTIKAGGVGITLHAARTIVFVDRDWSPAINLQAEDRLHRIGQMEAVEVIDLIGKNTVDLGRHQKLALKWKWLSMILGDKVPVEMVIEDLNDVDTNAETYLDEARDEEE